MKKEFQPKNSDNDVIRPGARSQKALIIYCTVAVVVSILLGMITITNLNVYIPGALVIASQLFAFAAFGLLHASLFNKYTLTHRKFQVDRKFVFSGLIFLFVVLVLVVMYAITNTNMIRMAFTSACAFLLPLIIMEAWKAYTSFPQKEFPLWYNSDGVIDTRTTIFLNSVPIRLRLAMKYFDIEEETFELTVPGHTQFGKFFNQFIIEQNKGNISNIECVDLEKKPFGWQFFTKRLGGLYTQIIDPELSLRENNISDHSTITAKRRRTISEPAKENPEPVEVKALPLVQTK